MRLRLLFKQLSSEWQVHVANVMTWPTSDMTLQMQELEREKNRAHAAYIPALSNMYIFHEAVTPR